MKLSIKFSKNIICSIGFGLISILFFMNPYIFKVTGSIFYWNIDKNTYNDIGIYFINDDYIVTPNPKTTTDYEFNQIKWLSEKLSEDNINLLYVNKPTKYLDDNIFSDYGFRSYCNENADIFLNRLKESEINYLDLRDEIIKDNLDIYSMFYRTDHHWTVPAGKWGAEKIAKALNQYCNYSIDTYIYNNNYYTFKTTYNAWLGEQGSKFAGSDIKNDDYTIVTPNFATEYLSLNTSTDFSGLFIKDLEACYHYNYQAKQCTNEKNNQGNILFLGDSFDTITEPFLSLSVHKIDFIILRDYCAANIYEEKIKHQNFDTVIICYASFMIGAHDDPTSGNSRMFTFNNEIQ